MINIDISAAWLTWKILLTLAISAFVIVVSIGARKRWQIEALAFGGVLAGIIWFLGDQLYTLTLGPVLDIYHGTAITIFGVGAGIATVGTFAIALVGMANLASTVKSEGGMRAFL